MATQTANTYQRLYIITIVENTLAITGRTKNKKLPCWWQWARVQIGYKVHCENGSSCPTFATRRQAVRYIAVRGKELLDW